MRGMPRRRPRAGCAPWLAAGRSHQMIFGARAEHRQARIRMPRIAFTTFAVLKEPYGAPEVEGFENLLPPTLEEAERSLGFIAHPVEDHGQSHLSVFDR